MNQLEAYKSNVLDLVQDAMDHLRLIGKSKGNQEDLDVLIPDMEQRLKRISHMQPEETIEQIEEKVPLHYTEQTGQIIADKKAKGLWP